MNTKQNVISQLVSSTRQQWARLESEVAKQVGRLVRLSILWLIAIPSYAYAQETHLSAPFTEASITSNYTRPMTIDLKFMVANNPAFEGSETYAGYFKTAERLRVERGGKSFYKVPHAIVIDEETINLDVFYDLNLVEQFDEDSASGEATVYTGQEALPKYVRLNQRYRLNDYKTIIKGPVDKVVEEGSNFFALRKIELGFEACEISQGTASGEAVFSSACYMFGKDAQTLLGVKIESVVKADGEIVYLRGVGFLR